MEIRLHINERLGRDVGLQGLGFRWETSCWRVQYSAELFVEAMWLVSPHLKDLLLNRPIIVVFNDGKYPAEKHLQR